MPIFKLGEFVKGKTAGFVISKSKNPRIDACKLCCFHNDDDFNCAERRSKELNRTEACDLLIGDGTYFFEEIRGGL